MFIAQEGVLLEEFLNFLFHLFALTIIDVDGLLVLVELLNELRCLSAGDS